MKGNMKMNSNDYNLSSDEIIENARNELLGAPQLNKGQINWMGSLNEILLSRHECLKVIEEVISNNDILIKFFISPLIINIDDSEPIGSKFKVALESMARIIQEYESLQGNISDSQLLSRIRDLETENSELRSKIDRIIKVFDDADIK